MSERLTAEDARQSLNAHAAAKGTEIFAKYGPQIGWEQLVQILQDRQCVRYPCELVFSEEELMAGEFAHPLAKGEHPSDGFTMWIHPWFQNRPGLLPYLVLYQLVLVNYGPFASPEDAEVFGANALGIDRDEYYQTLERAVGELA